MVKTVCHGDACVEPPKFASGGSELLHKVLYVVGAVAAVTVAVEVFFSISMKYFHHGLPYNPDPDSCSCSCWDQKFRQGYDYNGYMSLYFNLDSGMMVLFPHILFFFVVAGRLAESLLRLVMGLACEFFQNLGCCLGLTSQIKSTELPSYGQDVNSVVPSFSVDSKRISWRTIDWVALLVLLTGCVYPVFYGFWACFNYIDLNDKRMLFHQYYYYISELLCGVCVYQFIMTVPSRPHSTTHTPMSADDFEEISESVEGEKDPSPKMQQNSLDRHSFRIHLLRLSCLSFIFGTSLSHFGTALQEEFLPNLYDAEIYMVVRNLLFVAGDLLLLAFSTTRLLRDYYFKLDMGWLVRTRGPFNIMKWRLSILLRRCCLRRQTTPTERSRTWVICNVAVFALIVVLNWVVEKSMKAVDAYRHLQ